MFLGALELGKMLSFLFHRSMKTIDISKGHFKSFDYSLGKYLFLSIVQAAMDLHVITGSGLKYF